jgi:intracellular septation protein A
MVIGFSFLAANLVFGFLFDSSGIAAAAMYSIATTVIAIAALAGFQALGRKMWAS